MNLKERRTEMRLSQRELAEALGVNSNTLARWERGVMPISQPRMLELALEALDARMKAEGASRKRTRRPRRAS